MDLKTQYSQQIQRNTLQQLIPVRSYDGGSRFFYLEDGHLGWGYISSPLQSGDDSVIQRMNVLFSFDYPPDSFIQVLLIGSQGIQPKLRAIENSRKTKNPELKQSLPNRIKMLDAATMRPIDPNAVAYIRQFKIVFTIKIPLKDKKGLPLGDDMKRGNELKLSFSKGIPVEPIENIVGRQRELIQQIVQSRGLSGLHNRSKADECRKDDTTGAGRALGKR